MCNDGQAQGNHDHADHNAVSSASAAQQSSEPGYTGADGKSAASAAAVAVSESNDGAFNAEQDLRARRQFHHLLGVRAFGPGEYIGQQSFISASEIAELLLVSGLGVESEVLDLCCGAGAVGLSVARSTGCRLVGVDRSPMSVHLAQESAATVPAARAAFIVGDAEHIPTAGPFSGVLLIETFLAIRRKRSLVQSIYRLLRPGGCFIATVEAGSPLSADERRDIPGAETIRLLHESSLRPLLVQSGFSIRSLTDLTEAHARVAAAFARLIEQEADIMICALGEAHWQQMLVVHQRWAEWLTSGRVRKLAFVAEHPAGT